MKKSKLVLLFITLAALGYVVWYRSRPRLKVAVVLHGESRSMATKAFLDRLREANPKVKIDVYFHCWSTSEEHKQSVLKEFRPVHYRFEEPRNLPRKEGSRGPLHYNCKEIVPHMEQDDWQYIRESQLYSREKAIEVFQPRASQYDLAISTRFDFKQKVEDPIRLESLQRNLLHIGTGGYGDLNDNILISSPKIICNIDIAHRFLDEILTCDTLYKYDHVKYRMNAPEIILRARVQQLGLLGMVRYHQNLEWIRP